jgi:hypothetical protein
MFVVVDEFDTVRRSAPLSASVICSIVMRVIEDE